MAQAEDAPLIADSRPDGAPPQETVREVSLADAISSAIALLRSGRLEDAERLFRTILEVAPDEPVALQYAGVLAHKQGRAEEGIALIEQSLQADPSQADWHSNLGIALRAAGRDDEAMAAYRRAIALDPGHAKAHNNLGVLQKMRGLAPQAEASYREAIRLEPDYAEAHYNLGNLLWDEGRTAQAVAAFNRALVLSPETRATRHLRIRALCALGEPGKAVRIFDEWLREEPGNPVALHLRAACSGETVPERAADDYVERTFDSAAGSYDTHLAELGYCAPAIVTAMLAEAGAPATAELDVLDAGCGTGLCGPLLKPYARRLVGVDLSGQMLSKAREKGAYDDLCQTELTAYLAAHPAAFDVVVSADTLVYFGGLQEVVSAASRALRPGGSLVFTVEAEVGEPAASGYRLHYHGRYVHARDYLERVLTRAGFRAEIGSVELRLEGGRPVAGYVVRATRPAGAGGPQDGADDA